MDEDMTIVYKSLRTNVISSEQQAGMLSMDAVVAYIVHQSVSLRLLRCNAGLIPILVECLTCIAVTAEAVLMLLNS